MKWIDIKGWKGIYQLNRKGQVRSLPRWRSTGTGERLIPGKIMTATKRNHGNSYYLYFHFRDRKRVKIMAQHRLIAEHFKPNPHKKKLINHKNGIKWDNRIPNIEWVTSKENCDHAIKIGIAPIGQQRPSSKLTDKDVRTIKRSSKGKKELSVIFGVSPSCIWQIIRGRNWKHIQI